MSDISVVICAYSMDRWDALLAAIASIRGQTQPPREVILVIDHNPDLLDRARRELPDVCVANNHAERGLSGARNTGIGLAGGSIVAFLDDDAWAAPDWLERLAARYAAPDVIGVGGAIVPDWVAGRPGWFPAEFDWVVGCTYRGLPEEPAPIRNLIGANMSLRSEVFRAVGGFREGMGRVEKLPAGCEETELCIRAGRRWPAGRLLYDPRARVTHRVPPERSRLAYFVARCFAEGESKAQVVRQVGAADGLSAERNYTRRILPLAVWTGVQDAFGRGDWSGIERALAIVAGLAMTASGYLTGRWLGGRPRSTSGRLSGDKGAVALR